MEINIFLIFIIILIIFALGVFVQNLGKQNLLSLLLHSVEMGAIPAALVAGAVYFFTTDVYIVYSDGSHEEKSVLCSCKVRDAHGNEQELGGLGMRNKYFYNGTDAELVEYCVTYGSRGGGYHSTVTLHPGLNEISEEPDFYFHEPESIKVDKDIFTWIYELFAGSSDERWIINYADKVGSN